MIKIAIKALVLVVVTPILSVPFSDISLRMALCATWGVICSIYIWPWIDEKF